MNKQTPAEAVQEIGQILIFSKSFPGKSGVERLQRLFVAAFEKYSPETSRDEINALARAFVLGSKSVEEPIPDPVKKYLSDLERVRAERHEQEESRLWRTRSGFRTISKG